MTDKSQQEELSDYDKEWASEEDSQETPSVDTEKDRQTADESTDSDAAPSTAEDTTSEESTSQAEVSKQEEDIWANVPDEAKEAYRRAENARLAAEQKAKRANDSLAERGRELKTLREEKRELEQQTRTPTGFEQEFEGFGRDVNEIVNRALEDRGITPEAEPEEKTPEQIEEEFFDTLTQAHPDAGDVYNSEEMASMLKVNPPIVVNGQPVMFNDALYSEDANMVVEALNHFKSNLPSPATGDTASLDAMAGPAGESTVPDTRTQSQLSVSEQYDREWESDEI